ncbi:DUF3037 domain-containing protein [Mesorhizobium opportunistum]|uniref:DUF3037 domain-containing protein n=1 Tax=Mesorhizobium opportunistum TaxID=593909 RepID=A0ABV1Y995_9HYPH|nr:DUF3037 domain-containing protein [Mesorhizobium sp.]TIN97832.1 MAG: DUF3037 domain-containing protein [Mesorhizobium sp.]TJV01328.1 MAG: DUF3037 domain-containing protein [Mesorhizobium sp.]TJV19939.1 MAG: DUF3037 domain-containing protein [Mesorhizobium sp.]
MANIYKFAILRLVPFAHRGEALNVGVLVFGPARLDVRLSASASLLGYFGIQASTLDWLAENLVRGDNSGVSVEERAAEVARFAGVQLSDIGWFGTDDDSQYDPRIAEILAEYVDKPKKSKVRRDKTTLSKDLRKTFKEYKIFSSKIEDLHHHKVVANMPVGPSGKLHVDFLIKNGIYHATETIDFRHSEDAGPAELKNAALANVTFQHAREVLGFGSTRCYLVYAAPSLVESAVSPALEIARKDASDSFNLESREDKARYLDTILAAAGVNHLFS